MKKRIGNIVLMFVLVNTAAFAGAWIAGRPFAFNPPLNLVSPLLASFLCWEVDQNKARQQ